MHTAVSGDRDTRAASSRSEYPSPGPISAKTRPPRDLDCFEDPILPEDSILPEDTILPDFDLGGDGFWEAPVVFGGAVPDDDPIPKLYEAPRFHDAYGSDVPAGDASPQNSIPCDECGQRFSGLNQRANLRRHVESVHAQSQFHCDVEGCNVTFNRIDNLRVHAVNAHSGKPCERPDCTYVATDQSEMKLA
jgi:hypothetical protein